MFRTASACLSHLKPHPIWPRPGYAEAGPSRLGAQQRPHRPAPFPRFYRLNSSSSAGDRNTPSGVQDHPGSGSTKSLAAEGQTEDPTAKESVGSPLWPGSQAHLRRKPHASSLFGFKAVSAKNAYDSSSTGKAADYDKNFGDDDEDLDNELPQYKSEERSKMVDLLGKALRKKDVKWVTELASEFIQWHWKRGLQVPYWPYRYMLAVYSFYGYTDECWKIFAEMEHANVSRMDRNKLNALQWILRSAAQEVNEESVYLVLDELGRVGNPPPPMPRPALASEHVAASALPTRQTVSYLDALFRQDIPYILTHNFSHRIYTELFRFYHATRNPEQALLLFGAMIRSEAIAATAFAKLLRPESTKWLVRTLLKARELKLASQIAEWISEEHPAAVGSDFWLELLSHCALRGYLPGIRVAWSKVVVHGDVVPDEGLCLQALSVAGREADVDLCLDIVQVYTTQTLGWRPSASADVSRPPLSQAHLIYLLEAYTARERFEEAIRLAGAMAYWYNGLSYAALQTLERVASKDHAQLDKATEAWSKVAREGFTEKKAAATQSEEETEILDKSDLKGYGRIRGGHGDHRANYFAQVANGDVPALVGQVDVSTMNALIEAAGRRGKEDLAISLWERRSETRVRKQDAVSIASSKVGQSTTPERSPLQPNARTFAALMRACMERSPPSLSLASSFYHEMRRDFPEVHPSDLLYERLIIAHVLPDAAIAVKTAEAHLRQALQYLEECKSSGLIPSRATYEALIRATTSDLLNQSTSLSLPSSSASGSGSGSGSNAVSANESRCNRLIEEMRQAGWAMTQRLEAHLMEWRQRNSWTKRMEQRQGPGDRGAGGAAAARRGKTR